MRFPHRLALAGAVLLAAILTQAKTLVHAGTLIDGRADTPRKAITITVEGGKFADLVAVPGDPLADIKLMTSVTFVMKAGTVYKQ